jgi:hypothetical protein
MQSMITSRSPRPCPWGSTRVSPCCGNAWCSRCRTDSKFYPRETVLRCVTCDMGSTPPWFAHYCSLKIYLSLTLSIPPTFYCSFSPYFPRLRCLYLSLLPFLPSIALPFYIIAEQELLGVGYTIGAPSLPSHCFCHCS